MRRRCVVGRAVARDLGDARSVRAVSRPISCRGRSLVARDAVARLARSSAGLAPGHARDHARGASLRRSVAGRRLLGILLRPVAAARAQPVSLCGHPAGDADRRDRAADHHLGQGYAFLSLADLRLDRRVLSRSSPTPHSASTAPTAICVDLFRLYGASRWQTLLLSASCRRRCRISRRRCASAAGWR